MLDLLEDLATNKPDDYAKFWSAFGVVFKEGLVEDHGNRERIAKLCRFYSSTQTESPTSRSKRTSRACRPSRTASTI